MKDSERILSPFQREGYTRLSELLEGKRVRFSSNILGERESYIKLNVDEPKMIIWLYEDEAELRSSSDVLLFETPDFPDWKSLLNEFVRNCGEIIERAKPSS